MENEPRNTQELTPLGLAKSLEESLALYLRQPKADPRVLKNVEFLLSQLSNALMYAGDGQGGQVRQSDLDAVILGAAMVLDPARERKHTLDSTADTARRFVELVNQRFAELK